MPACALRMANVTVRVDHYPSRPIVILSHRRPVHCRGRRLVDTVVVDVLDDADHFTPRRHVQRPNTLADRGGRRPPELAGEVLRHHHHGTAVVEIGPRVVATRDQSGAGGLKKIGRERLEQPEGRNLVGPVCLALGHDAVPVRGEPFHGHHARERHGRHARDRRQLVDDVVLQSCDSFRFRDQRGWNRDAHRLELLGLGEPRLNGAQRLERANHQPRAHQQHQRHRDLGHDQEVACPMTFSALARGPPSAA